MGTIPKFTTTSYFTTGFDMRGCVQRLQRPNHIDELLRPAQRFWQQAIGVSVKLELQLAWEVN
jgi:hypothetical protein